MVPARSLLPSVTICSAITSSIDDLTVSLLAEMVGSSDTVPADEVLHPLQQCLSVAPTQDLWPTWPCWTSGYALYWCCWWWIASCLSGNIGSEISLSCSRSGDRCRTVARDVWLYRQFGEPSETTGRMREVSCKRHKKMWLVTRRSSEGSSTLHVVYISCLFSSLISVLLLPLRLQRTSLSINN